MNKFIQSAGLHVGYGKVDITPSEPMPLQGFGNDLQRISNEVLDLLHATCTAFAEADGETILLFSMDLCQPRKILAQLRKTVSEATGVPEGCIMYNVSHTHSAPSLEFPEDPRIARYIDFLLQQLSAAAEAALEDLKPAQMYIGTVPVIGQTFLRHYVLPDGSSVGWDYMARHSNPVDHEGIPDHTMQLVKFVREGGKDVLLVNFQSHNTRALMKHKLAITADVVGVIRAALEEALDSHVAYVNGASGNVNFSSLVQAEKNQKTYVEQGREIANVVIHSAPYVFTKVETGKLRLSTCLFKAEVIHKEDHLLEQALAVQSFWVESGNDRTATNAFAEQYGIQGPYHAESIIKRSALPKTMDVEMDVIAMGDTAIVLAPFEMFTSIGLCIKRFSPFRMTFISAFSNDCICYLPDMKAFSYPCYERDETFFVKGTAEAMIEKYVSMMEALRRGG